MCELLGTPQPSELQQEERRPTQGARQVHSPLRPPRCTRAGARSTAEQVAGVRLKHLAGAGQQKATGNMAGTPKQTHSRTHLTSGKGSCRAQPGSSTCWGKPAPPYLRGESVHYLGGGKHGSLGKPPGLCHSHFKRILWLAKISGPSHPHQLPGTGQQISLTFQRLRERNSSRPQKTGKVQSE